MKTIKELKSNPSVYLNNWKSYFDLVMDFEGMYFTENEYYNKSDYISEKIWEEKKKEAELLLNKWEGTNILFASYGCELYEGSAFVLLEINDKLYEVNGFHCSCYGLEGQFEPKETTLEELKFRLENGNFGKDENTGNIFSNELKQFLGI